MNTEKLAEIFEGKFESILHGDGALMLQNVPLTKAEMDSRGFSNLLIATVSRLWVDFLNEIDCRVIEKDEILEDFPRIFNCAQNLVCIGNPLGERRLWTGVGARLDFEPYFILVSKELAERALVLGGLPETWPPR